MGKVENYRAIIKSVLTEYHELFLTVPTEGVDLLLAFDEERDQYLWFQVGWTSQRRVKGNSVHIQIKNEKIYIEEDWTEEGIATDLLEKGIPKEDIVLAFHAPETRKYTEFAIA